MVAKSIIALVALSFMAALPIEAVGDEFSSVWYDGRAELNGYKLKMRRYGEVRDGTAVLIYVTEPFSKSRRVKVNDADANPSDTFTALKLNLVRDFQTGIYDYNTMVSVFAHVGDFAPSKISFTSAEWCGHVYEELLFDRDKVRGFYASYFEGESGERGAVSMPGGVAEDNLYILLRGLRGDYLEPGESKTVPLLPSVYFGRLAHEPLKWVRTRIERKKDTETIDVPAGKFETMVYEVRTDEGRQGKFHIENRYPHRLIRWEMLPDVRAELTGSERLAYWKLNGSGDERYLEKLGLQP